MTQTDIFAATCAIQIKYFFLTLRGKFIYFKNTCCSQREIKIFLEVNRKE